MCEYSVFCEDYNLVDNIEFDDVLINEMSAKELLEKVKKNNEVAEPDKANKETEKLLLDKDKAKAKKDMEDHEAKPESESDEEDDSVRMAAKGGKADLSKEQETDMDVDDDGDIDAKDLKKLRKKKKVKEENEVETETSEDETESSEEEDKSISKEAFLETLKDFEELMTNITPEEEEDKVDTAETDEYEA